MTTLSEIRHLLAEPFPSSIVEVKPGATNQEGTKALALAYVDARHYQARLDDAAGPDAWDVRYRPVSDRATVCRLTIYGVVREDVGEADATDQNQATSAAMQAFKRACAAFGLGRYLYTDLPQIWVEAEKFGKNVKIKDPAGAVWKMYQQAGIKEQRTAAPMPPTKPQERPQATPAADAMRAAPNHPPNGNGAMGELRNELARLRNLAIKAEIKWKPVKSPADMSDLELRAAIDQLTQALEAVPA